MSVANQANALLNRALPLDSSMIMNILIELLNSKPLKCVVIPDFRIDQLIKMAMRRVSPVSEKKLLEAVCSSYCLCMYFALTTNYSRGHTFRFLATIQTLQAEALVAISNFGAGNKIQMPDLHLSLQKDEALDINYKLETFSDSLAIAKLICRDLYALMKIVFRVGRRGAHTASFTPDEKRRQLKYTESVQPQSLYYMCTFAYAHIAVVLHASNNLNIYPGMVESVLLMTLTTTPAACNAIVARAMPADSQSPDSIIQETQRAAQEAHAQRQSAHSGPTEAEAEAAKPVVAAMKLSYELLIESAHKLAVFVAHIVCDDRSLQEARLAHGRLCRHFNHPNIVFAQFRTSGVKALLAQDQPQARKLDPAQTTHMGRTINGNSTPSTPANTTVNGNATGGLSPLQKLKQKHGNMRVTTAMDTKPVHATSSAIVDISKSGYHILNKASRPADWQVQDPLEQDLDHSVSSPKSPKSPSNRLSADRLSALGSMKSPLPALPLSGRAPSSPSRRNNPRTPSDRNTGRAGGGGQGGKHSVESISELPLTSSRTGRDTASRGGQRSARAPKSSRSLSSDGGGSDTSDSSSHRASSRGDSASQVSQKLANPFVLMSKQPNLISQFRRTHTSTTVKDGAIVNMDQLIAGYWAMNKIYRPMFVVFDALHTYPEYQLYFPEEYKPAPFEIRAEEDLTKLTPALSHRAVHEACKVIEAQYYHLSAAVRLPRILDPTQDSYWICSYLVDYLAKQTTLGEGFHPSTATELNTLKKRFKTLRLQHTTATSATSDKHYRSLPQLTSKAATQKTTSARTTLNISTTSSASPTKGPRAAPSLQDRLAAAAIEASMESKLFTMEKKLHTEQQVLQDTWMGHDTTASQAARPRFLSDFSELDTAAPPGHEEAADDSTPSVVWTCVAKQAHQAVVMFTGHDDDEMDTNPFTERIPKKIAAEYAKKVLEKQREAAEQEMQHKQYLADQAENIIAKNRAAKAERIRAIREQTKEELMNKSKFKNEWEQLQRKQLAIDKAKAKMEAKEKEDNALKEIMRVKEVKLIHENRLRQAEMERQAALKREAEKIQMLTSADEVAYINRQNQEEARMKFLEERRREIEEKLVVAAEVKKAKLARKQARTADVRDHMQSRVRMGTFKYHNGQFGFYDAVRAAPVEWVQYEDADGNPYYYDPISQQSQYRMPVDADIHHYTEDERRIYDGEHGEGAYDAYMADKAFKDGVNQNGGYYNEKGLWIEMDGYYDENYNWVPNEGYYDENGRYRKYAKVCGDLSFMV